MRYDHTQTGPWFLLLHAGAAAVLIATLQLNGGPSWVSYLMIGMFVLFAGLGFTFVHLNVRGMADRLVVRFGPLRLFGTTISYEEITGLAADRSTLLNGWGIHVRQGGWIYNIWGYDCIRIERGEKATWIGTNDIAGLMALLEERSGLTAEARVE